MKGAAIPLLAVLLAACGGIPPFEDQTGLACLHPPRAVDGADERDPFGPGEAFAGLDVTEMTAAEVATTAMEAGLELTWRYSYAVRQPAPPQPGTETSYSECWCVQPPGRVTSLSFDTGGRLIIAMNSGLTMPQARPQPRMGWGCEGSV